MSMTRKTSWFRIQEVRPAAVFKQRVLLDLLGYMKHIATVIWKKRMVESKKIINVLRVLNKISAVENLLLMTLTSSLSCTEGLTDDENFKEFTELVDIDNFIMYYAIQIYIDNKDWRIIISRRRYYPSEGETDLTEYHDGRWRFIVDAEFAWGLYSNGYRDRTLTNVLQGTNHLGGDSLLLKAVLERDDMKEKFANMICDLIYGAFETENVNHTLDHLISISDNELMYALKNGYVSQWATPFSFSKSRDEIREFAKHRPSVVLKDIEQCFELDNSFYTITLKGSKGASAYLNTQEAKNGDTVKGKYFASYSVPVTAFMYDGYEFSHWEINGIEYYSETVNVTADMANDENEISIRLFVIETDSYADLLITEVYAGGDADWTELYNPTDKPVNTKGLFLSDTLENLQRWSFSGNNKTKINSYCCLCKQQ